MAETPIAEDTDRASLLVLASTYPRWKDDAEPGFVHELSRRLTGHFSVSVVCPHARGALAHEIMDGVEVIRYRYAPAKLETLVNDGGIVSNLRRNPWKLLLIPTFVLSQAWVAIKLLRSRRFDIIHAHWLIPQGLICRLLRIPGLRKHPFVVTAHGADLFALRGRLLAALKRDVVRAASATTVVSSAMMAQLDLLGADTSRTLVQPMGVDLKTVFVPPPPSKPRRNQEILFVGRLVEKKGLTHLLDAMPAVLARFPAAQLTIAGFGPEEARLKSQASSLGITLNIAFLGPVPQQELPALYQRATAFVAPFIRAISGDEEGLGLVLVEAIGCGCPVLAGNVPSVNEVFGSGYYDNRIDPADTAEVARKIIAILASPEEAMANVMQLREDLMGRFDWDHVAARYARLLVEHADTPHI